MKLVLAEKPSVAQSIAKVLGATKREDGYLEGNGYVVSWCVGHLVELSQPEAYDEKYNKWAYADLPIFPDQWKYQVSASTKKQFGILKKLMARKDVESLVCATDAGREGELIFRLVYQQAGCRKPFERLWISSMEDSAIREGFEQLKPSTEYDALYEAALCRERADWLVGINATRLFSTLYGQTLNVGRVMTPTLAMVVMREAAISAFRPEPFYTVELAFQDFTASGERMKQKVLADDVARKCVGSVLNVTKAENKEKSEKPPALYDLTSLQRDANRVLGFTAQQTLDYTQSLYEKKLVTYPRTDSRYLTSDMKDMLPELIKSLFNIFPVEDVKNVPVHAAQVINDKKVSDHHAIIPTKEAIKCSLDDLPKGEQAILRLIATRLFCAVGEPFRYNESVIELSDGNYIFSAKGKTTVQSGWKIFSGKPADKDATNVELVEAPGYERTKVAESLWYLYCRKFRFVRSLELRNSPHNKRCFYHWHQHRHEERIFRYHTLVHNPVQSRPVHNGRYIHSEAVPTAHHPPDTSAASQWAEIFESSYRLPCGTLHLLQARRELKSPASGPQ